MLPSVRPNNRLDVGWVGNLAKITSPYSASQIVRFGIPSKGTSMPVWSRKPSVPRTLAPNWEADIAAARGPGLAVSVSPSTPKPILANRAFAAHGGERLPPPKGKYLRTAVPLPTINASR